MENRFLCRGKRSDTGEWVEGHLITDETDDSKCFIGYVIGTDENGAPHDLDVVQVDPSTICQCTGIKDDEGTLIFENDVLYLKDGISGYDWKAVVKFGNPSAEYTWGWQLVPLTECDANKDILMWVETGMGYMYCNITGNKFDNPELLEVHNDGK